jgi:hypothetical protein
LSKTIIHVQQNQTKYNQLIHGRAEANYEDEHIEKIQQENGRPVNTKGGAPREKMTGDGRRESQTIADWISGF